MPECYVAKRRFKLECDRPLHRAVGGSTRQFFRYVLFE